MKLKRIDLPVWSALLCAVLIGASGNVWAVSASCQYTKPGTKFEGSGIGGTGMVAKGAGIGGTGARPDAKQKLQQIAGNVTESKGDVEARQNGLSRRLALNDPVCVGETVVTSKSGSVQIKMADEGLIEVRSQTKVRIEAFNYRRSRRKKSMIALIEGSSRFVTGKIGKEYPQNVIVKTPSAVIGVHGTDHEVTVILPGGRGDNPAGTYDKVNFGVTFIRTEGGEIDIHPAQVGFAAIEGSPPVLLDEIPGFLHGDHSMMQGNSAPTDKHSNAEYGESPFNELHSNHAGAESEHPDPMGNMPSTLEEHGIGEIPHLPEVHELPELPEKPELPEPPALPERPDN
jgi:hypothetical protein